MNPSFLYNKILLGLRITDLESTDSTGFNAEASSWTVSDAWNGFVYQTKAHNGFSAMYIVGGPESLGGLFTLSPGQYFQRIYTGISDHTFVDFTATFWFLDQAWGNQVIVKLYFDGTVIDGPYIRSINDMTMQSGGSDNTAGTGRDLGFDHVYAGVAHTGSTLTLRMISQQHMSFYTYSFGFRDITLRFNNYTGTVAMCHRTLEIDYLDSSQCPCPIGQTLDASNACVACATNCDECTGTAASDCVKCSSGAHYDGAQCTTCHQYCRTCTGSLNTDCSECATGYYNYMNGLCDTTCPSPRKVVWLDDQMACLEACPAGSYYWVANRTCISSCPSPLTPTTYQGILFCDNPCPNPDTDYIFPNNSYIGSCPSPLISLNYPGVNYCINPCQTSEYLYSNSSCSSLCGSPLVSRTEPGPIRYCFNPCPDRANDFLYYNGSCLAACVSPLVSRVEAEAKFCWNPCLDPVNEFLYYNGSCLTTCISPLVSRQEDGVKYCWNPCPDPVNQFLYYNNSACLNDCIWPLVWRQEDGVKYCWNPCEDPVNEFLYYNGTCSLTCQSPLVWRQEIGVKYCWNPCEYPDSEYLYVNGTCSTTCQYPLAYRIEPGVMYCFNPCVDPVNEFLYTNQSCISDCIWPLVWRQEPDVKYCFNPCLDPVNEFLYTNGSCFTTCPAPLANRTEPEVKYCFNPCSDPSVNFLYTNGSCFDSCPLPLANRTEPDVKYCFNPCVSVTDYLYSNQACYSFCPVPLVVRKDPGVIYCENPCPNQADSIHTDGLCLFGCSYPYIVVPNPVYGICTIDLATGVVKVVQQLSYSSDITQYVAQAGGLVNTVLSVTDPTSMGIGSLAKMLQYIKYMNIVFPPKVYVTFAEQNKQAQTTGFMARAGGEISEKFANRPLPGKFDYYEIPSSFVVNLWQQLIILIAIFVTTILIILFYFATKKSAKIHAAIRKVADALKWNVVLIIFCGTYGDIMLYSALEIQSAELDDAYSIASFCVCVLVNVCAGFVLVKILLVNLALKGAKETITGENRPEKVKEIEEKYKNYKAFFEMYKDDSFSQQLFLFIYILRVSVFNLIIGYMYKYPLTQALFLMLINGVMACYLVIKRPMRKLINFVQQLTIEFTLFIFNICVLTLAFLDALNTTSESLRTTLGDIMMIINVIAPFLSSALIIVKMLLILRELYLDHKKSKKDKLKELNLKGRVLTEELQVNKESMDASPGGVMQVIELDKSSDISVNMSYNDHRDDKTLTMMDSSSMTAGGGGKFFIERENLNLIGSSILEKSMEKPQKGKFRRGPSRFAPPMFEENSTFDMDSSQIHMLSNQATTSQGGYTINQTQNYVLNQTKIYMVNSSNQDNSYDSVLLSSNENQSFSMSNSSQNQGQGGFRNYANHSSYTHHQISVSGQNHETNDVNQGGSRNYANHSNYTHHQNNMSTTNSGQNRRGYVSKQSLNNLSNNPSHMEGKEILRDFF